MTKLQMVGQEQRMKSEFCID